MVATVAVAALALPSSGLATVTIGPDLSTLTPASTGYNCNAIHRCTLVNAAVGPGFGGPGLVSPVNGTITHLRVRTGPQGSAGFSFRLLTPVEGGGYRSGITFGVVPSQLPPNSTIELPGFPIDAGEAIGVDCCQGASNNITSATVPGSGSFLVWGTGSNSPLSGGETRFPDRIENNALLMLNAEIEPATGAVLQDARMVQKGRTVTATVSAPNPGLLTAGGGGLQPITMEVPAPPPDARALFSSIVPLSVRTTKAGRARFLRGKKLTLEVAFTPTFGSTARSAASVQRPKRPKRDKRKRKQRRHR